MASDGFQWLTMAYDGFRWLPMAPAELTRRAHAASSRGASAWYGCPAEPRPPSRRHRYKSLSWGHKYVTLLPGRLRWAKDELGRSAREVALDPTTGLPL